MKTSRIVILLLAVLATTLFALVLSHQDVGAREAQSIEGSAP